MTVVHDAIAEELALLSKEVPTPVAPFGYGVDLACVDDLGDALEEVDPFSTQAVSEAIIRRLTTRRGQLVDDLDYGLDVRGFLNKGRTEADMRALASEVVAEVKKDERVDAAEVTVVAPAYGTLRIAARITPVDSSNSFDLVFAVTSSEVLTENVP
jgi:hypothetical protein